MARRFSEEDILEIKKKLKSACEMSWRTKGYKQTNIPSLTKEVGISTGSFYLIYKTKEELFVEVLQHVQSTMLTTWARYIEEADSALEGFKQGMNWLYHEYRSYPALYDFNSPEYDLFLAKLPKEKIRELEEASMSVFSKMIVHSKLRLKLSEEETINIISTILFLSLIERDTLKATEKTFTFLMNHALDDLFEEV